MGSDDATSDNGVLKVTGLTKRFRRTGVFATQSIDLSLRTGEILGLLGPNGAGKTTLVRMVMGLLRPTAGSIALFGRDIIKEPTFPSEVVGYYGQRALYLWSYRVWDIIYHTARLRGLAPAEAKRQTQSLIETFNLGGIRDRLLWYLSGGQARLAALCASLVGNLPMLILDEPTNELDPSLRRVVWDYLLGLSQNKGVSILLVTHNVLEAEQVVDRVVIIDEGRVKAVGSPGELKRQMGDEVRLEIRVAPGLKGPAAFPGILDRTAAREVRRDVWWVYSTRQEVSSLLGEVLRPGDDSRLEDFRVIPPTLEDIYVRLAGRGWK